MASKLYISATDQVRYIVYHVMDRIARWIAPSNVIVGNNLDGFFTAHVSAALVGLDVPTALANGPKTSEELAAQLEVDANRLTRLLTAARILGYVHLTKANTWVGTRLLSVLDPVGVQGLFALHQCSPSHAAAWGLLESTVRDGESGFRRVSGMSIWEWFAQNPSEAELNTALLEGGIALDMSFIFMQYKFPETGLICDVGGGSGETLAHVLTEYPQLVGALMDRPEVTDLAKLRFEGDIAERVSFHGGDMLKKVPVEADFYIVKSVLHNWSDKDCVTLIRNIRDAAKPGAKILIVELFLDRKNPLKDVAFCDLEVMVMFDEGRERTIAEIQGLLRAGGFQPGRVARTPLGLALIEGRV